MKQVIGIAKALSDPNRLRALAAVSRGELCVCQLIELLTLAPSTVSKHMTILKQAGLVTSRKNSRWVYYQPAPLEKTVTTGRFYRLVMDVLKHDPAVAKDRTLLGRIKRQEEGTPCRRPERT
jgi:DNA-binding transcriptional ArsR family regulator